MLKCGGICTLVRFFLVSFICAFCFTALWAEDATSNKKYSFERIVGLHFSVKHHTSEYKSYADSTGALNYHRDHFREGNAFGAMIDFNWKFRTYRFGGRLRFTPFIHDTGGYIEKHFLKDSVAVDTTKYSYIPASPEIGTGLYFYHRFSHASSDLSIESGALFEFYFGSNFNSGYSSGVTLQFPNVNIGYGNFLLSYSYNGLIPWDKLSEHFISIHYILGKTKGKQRK